MQEPAKLEEQARQQPLRLAYAATIVGRIATVRIAASTRPGGPALSDSELAQLFGRLHPLDQVVVRELRSGSVFGQVADAAAARLLPLLAQRETTIAGARLTLHDVQLTPRARLEIGANGRLLLRLAFFAEQTGWLEAKNGRLLAGSRAFFLADGGAYPVNSPNPWELSEWAHDVERTVDANLTVGARDQLSRSLVRAGVPESDLAQVAVHRGPPTGFAMVLDPPVQSEAGVTLSATLLADYEGHEVALDSHAPESPYLIPEGLSTGALIERDLVAEINARAHLRRLGFRFEPRAQRFVAEGETALTALDPEVELFPATWRVVRPATSLHFHAALQLKTEIRLDAPTGLLDLKVGISGRDADDAAVLIEMRELLEWLQSKQRYLRLRDGSFARPNERFKKALRLLGDLGASADRLLVSPLCLGLLRALGTHADVQAADQATRSWLEEISQLDSPREVAVPIDLQGHLRDYQRRGLDWLAMLHRHRLTGVLADDMGLGKTVQTLALLLHVRESEGRRPSLVIAPTSVVTVWRDEVARFTPSLRLWLWHGAPKVRADVEVKDYDLVVTSYGVLRRDAERLREIGFRYVILDEAQSAKNSTTQNSRAIRRLTSERRLALTGTPIENRPEELWSTFDFLAPGFLGSLRHFKKSYGRPIASGDHEAIELLRTRIAPFVLRRLKTDVAKELPPKIESVVRCEMLPAQRLLYDHIAGELRTSVQLKIAKVGIERAQLDILAALTRLRQICCDPSLLPTPPGVKVPGSAKLQLFEELMREALESEHRVVVFSQFVQMQKRLIEVIRRLGVEPVWLHGGTRHRDRVVAAFQDPAGPPVIVVSLRAGGTGVTLTRADTVMHYDPWWNPAVEQQATDRTHRLGQRQQVTVYKLVCTRSIEERVVALAERKDAMARALLQATQSGTAKHIGRQEILELLGE